MQIIKKEDVNEFANSIIKNSELKNFYNVNTKTIFKNFNINITDEAFITLTKDRKKEFIELQRNNTHRFTIHTISRNHNQKHRNHCKNNSGSC